MANVGWRLFTIDHWKGSGQGCWKGGRYFWDKRNFWIDHCKTRWMYANLQAIQAIRGFVKHQIGNAPTINKPTSAPKVMAITENWELNIGPIVVGMIKTWFTNSFGPTRMVFLLVWRIWGH